MIASIASDDAPFCLNARIRPDRIFGNHSCRDVTFPASGEACAPVLALRPAQAAAERRDILDAELREVERQLRLLPPVTTADPQADIAARLINWMTFGLITITSNDIHLARIAGMTLMPQLAGLVLMLAATLWQSRP